MTVNYPNLLEKTRSLSEIYPTGFAIRRRGLYRNSLKRCFDTAIVLMALPFVLPIVLILAFLVMLDGGMPFYTQSRVGRDGRLFTMWKLRTMVPNADRRLESYLVASPAARLEWDMTQKLKCDPRITPLGHLLRKASLDELPQLWNVLTGDMSLVGPRPMMPEQQGMYPGLAYYALRPGITGPWQISDRNQSSFAARADFDSAYDRSVSFRTDMSILMATVAVVIHGTGY